MVGDDWLDASNDDTHLERCLRRQIDVLRSRSTPQMCLSHTRPAQRSPKKSPRAATTQGPNSTLIESATERNGHLRALSNSFFNKKYRIEKPYCQNAGYSSQSIWPYHIALRMNSASFSFPLSPCIPAASPHHVAGSDAPPSALGGPCAPGLCRWC